jgi:hypothetical protein
MQSNSSIRHLVLIWAGWALMLIAFQGTIGARLKLAPPDGALSWTAAETMPGSQSHKPYLNELFLNTQVSWDSEYYLSIAAVGYNDPVVVGIWPDFRWGAGAPAFCQPGLDPNCTSRSYAFFPLYPLVMRVVAWPLQILPLNLIARTTLAGVIVSLAGTLSAMLALYSMTRRSLGEEGALRAAFYLLIFPSSLFLAQIYTEGLFIGLTFGCLACLLECKWLPAALLATLAAWTRPGGHILLLPLAVVWLQDRTWRLGWKAALGRLLAVLAPVISYAWWLLTPLAGRFDFIEERFFGRGLLLLDRSFMTWQYAWSALSTANTQARFYYALEFAAIALGIACCLFLLRERPELSLFGLAMIVFALTSGPAQGMIRYVLAAPPLFWVLARWGRQPAFDRLWSLASILLLGLEATLFSFDFWVA